MYKTFPYLIVYCMVLNLIEFLFLEETLTWLFLHLIFQENFCFIPKLNNVLGEHKMYIIVIKFNNIKTILDPSHNPNCKQIDTLYHP